MCEARFDQARWDEFVGGGFFTFGEVDAVLREDMLRDLKRAVTPCATRCGAALVGPEPRPDWVCPDCRTSHVIDPRD